MILILWIFKSWKWLSAAGSARKHLDHVPVMRTSLGIISTKQKKAMIPTVGKQIQSLVETGTIKV